jgi:aspartate kinase
MHTAGFFLPDRPVARAGTFGSAGGGSMNPVVLKFGGTSVQDEQALHRLIGIVAATRGVPVVVVSALAGVTDSLAEIARMTPTAARADALAPILDRHLALLAALTARAPQGAAIDHVSALFQGAASALRASGPLGPAARDALLGVGELAASRLVAAVLSEAGIAARWADARRAIITDDRFGAARPRPAETRDAVARELLPLLSRGHVPVVGGFVGATAAGKPTTLGRGGSDYSAAIVAAAVDASRVEIWTDVDGILSADPRIVPDARLVRRLSGVEAYDLARFGARVLHAGTLEPIAGRRIPVSVRNARRPASMFTEIGSAADQHDELVVGVAHRPAVSIVDLLARDLGTSAAFMDGVSACVDHGANHAVTPIVVSPQRAVIAVDDGDAAERVCHRLRGVADVASVERGGLVAVVGRAVHSERAIWRALLDLQERAAVHRVVQSSSGCALVAVTAPGWTDEVVRELHGAGTRRAMEVA